MPKLKSVYERALARPTGPGGKGWAHADPESVQAAAARALGGLQCLDPEHLFTWAQKFNVRMPHDITKVDEEPFGALLVAVLNDVTLAEARVAVGRTDAGR